jgi:hypothetical protein
VNEHKGIRTQKYAAALYLRDRVKFRLGLSVAPGSVVELRGGPFGAGWVGTIGEATQIVARRRSPQVTHDGYHLYHAGDLGVLARGWTGSGFGWKPVRTFIRHACDRPVRSLRVAGDTLTLTDDHSVFLARDDGSLEEVHSECVRRGDVLPVDTGRGWEGAEEVPVDVVRLASSFSKAQVIVDLSGTTRKALSVTPQQWQNFRKEAKFGPRLPVGLYLRHQRALPPPTGLYFSGCPRAQRIVPAIRLSEWAYMLGFFLGDGWLDAGSLNRVAFAVDPPRVDSFMEHLRGLHGVELHPTKAKAKGNSFEVRVSHTLFAHVLREAMGIKRCYAKEVPGEWIASWPRAARLELLRGIVDSDGHVGGKHDRRYVVSSSRRLARSLLSLLRSLGIVGSISKRRRRRGGKVRGRQIQERRPSYTVHWSKYAEAGDNGGHRGLRRRIQASAGRFHEGPVREVIPDVKRPLYVYDLEVDGHPSFVANGVLVHNTATPVFNYGNEIRAVLNALKEDAVGSDGEFSREWCKGHTGKKALVEDPRALGLHLRDVGLMVRHTRAEVGRELPKLSRFVHPVETEDDEIKREHGALTLLAEQLLDDGNPIDKMQVASEIDWRLRQATGVDKVPIVAEMAEIILASEQKLLIFGWHKKVYRLLSAKLAHFHPVFYTGDQTPTQKAAALKAFIHGPARILVMSLRAGEGVDGLQAVCSTALFAELDWSPKVMDQDIGRLHRDEQTKPVFAHIPLAASGSDPVMADTLGIKGEQSEGIINPNRPVAEQLGSIDPERMKKLAAAYLAQKDPERLAALRKREAEREAAKLSEKEQKRLAREALRGGTPVAPTGVAAPTAPPPEAPAAAPPPTAPPAVPASVTLAPSGGRRARKRVWQTGGC